MIYHSALELIGNTPLLRLDRIQKELGLQATIYAKIEAHNPGGSIKDRVAFELIEDAETRGELKSGMTIIEPTSGNTGIGLALVGALKGYPVILTMPESMSLERRTLLGAYGAKIVLTPASEGMAGSVKEANRLKESIPGAIILGQFENQANPRAHEKTTGPEICRDLENKVDIFVAGVGTGGTVSGVGRYLKSQIPGVKVVAVEPESSPLLSHGYAGPHKIQGIGANFVPEILDKEIIDRVIDISNEEAYSYARLFAQKEGMLIGISSGANLAAAIALAKEKENAGKTIVTVFPDGGDHYLSTDLFR